MQTVYKSEQFNLSSKLLDGVASEDFQPKQGASIAPSRVSDGCDSGLRGPATVGDRTHHTLGQLRRLYLLHCTQHCVYYNNISHPLLTEEICQVNSSGPVSYTHLTLPTNREV